MGAAEVGGRQKFAMKPCLGIAYSLPGLATKRGRKNGSPGFVDGQWRCDPRLVQSRTREIELYGPGHVGRIKALGALLALKLNGFAFIECLIAALLYSGKMDEHIFTT